MNAVTEGAVVRRDGIRERVPGAIRRRAVSVIGNHGSRNNTQVGRTALNGVLSGLGDFRFQQEAGNDALADQGLDQRFNTAAFTVKAAVLSVKTGAL